MTKKNSISGKPELNEYIKRFQDYHGIRLDDRISSYYSRNSEKIKIEFENSVFWHELTTHLTEYYDDYKYQTKGYELLINNAEIPTIKIKPYSSVLSKTYRKNVLYNDKWPNEPINGWVLPENWFFRITDVIRTMFIVKYLDGIQFLTDKLYLCSKFANNDIVHELKAKDEGYYAAHININRIYELPKLIIGTEKFSISTEIQITTQVQDVIRKLLHNDYEISRKELEIKDSNWKWNYSSKEFSTNYLGHILHYLEGNIMEVRDIESKMQNPRQIAQQFRSKSHSDSGVNRTPIPEQIAHF